MTWRNFQDRCDLSLTRALRVAREIADRAGAPWIGVEHLLRAMAADPDTLPARNIEGVDLFLEVLLTKLAADACRRAAISRGGDVVEILEPGPNGSSHDNWNVPVNADDDGQDQTSHFGRR
ncbi:hypothetical protein [Nocardia heshunensis]